MQPCTTKQSKTKQEFCFHFNLFCSVWLIKQLGLLGFHPLVAVWAAMHTNNTDGHLLQEVDAVKMSKDLGLVKRRRSADKDTRSEVKWGAVERAQGNNDATGGCKRKQPTLEDKWNATLQNKCCEACAENDSSPDPICQSKPRLWAYYRWIDVTRNGIVVTILVNEGASVKKSKLPNGSLSSLPKQCKLYHITCLQRLCACRAVC